MTNESQEKIWPVGVQSSFAERKQRFLKRVMARVTDSIVGLRFHDSEVMCVLTAHFHNSISNEYEELFNVVLTTVFCCSVYR